MTDIENILKNFRKREKKIEKISRGNGFIMRKMNDMENILKNLSKQEKKTKKGKRSRGKNQE